MHLRVDVFGDHVLYVVRDVGTQQDVAALLIDDLALLAHHVVELEQLFTDAEVAVLDAFLRAFDGPCNHLRLDGLLVVHTEPVHHPQHTLVGKKPHQVVFKRDVKTARAGVALTP